MRIIRFLLIALIATLVVPVGACAQNKRVNAKRSHRSRLATTVIVGAERTDQYLPLLRGKRIALLSNQTGVVGRNHDKHTLDLMLEKGLNVTTIFSPEHGFRGKADAGEHVSSSVDEKTGIPIASLYEGKSRMPSKETMDRFDVIVTDIQDVGLRFYTYYITMVNMMDAAATYDKEFVVFDRPNPNGMTVDGPILDMNLKSGVGRLPIPTVHGMTMGEIALMTNGEGWLTDGKKVKLTVIACKNYTHRTRYKLPIAPSPNLPNMLSVYLYPSTCYFEGTPVSLGRGTDWPFQVYGHPDMKGYSFSFTPTSRPGAKTPPQQDKLCHGVDLHNLKAEDVIAQGMNLEYVIDAYRNLNIGEKFFTKFFDLLAGRTYIREMILEGKSAQEIKAMWQDDVKRFKEQRRPYLLYKE
ncbi:MAG: DUF1343 domain-containing protein [Muribaculaceae bacterium]|nr:DUF1343 domain-containing protein [Muribaculaceae bacterium]